MLGRTAANLFWLARYVERAENMARLLEAGYRMSLSRSRDGSSSEHLVSMMQAAAIEDGFNEKYEVADLRSVINYMLFDPDNVSSVFNCLRNARTNGRAERTSMTTDMWESLNSTWLEFCDIKPGFVTEKQLPDLLAWIKRSSYQFRGALLGTVMRTDGFAFSQAGSFVERADNTARILDIKYYVLLPRATQIGGELDLQQWALILRATSAMRAYRHLYHDRFRSGNIAEFLILRPESPRSLLFSVRGMNGALAMLADIYGEGTAAQERGAELAQMLEGNDMERIFKTGLHEYLTGFIASNTGVTEALSESYNFL